MAYRLRLLEAVLAYRLRLLEAACAALSTYIEKRRLTLA
jgi:hypothetical protein